MLTGQDFRIRLLSVQPCQLISPRPSLVHPLNHLVVNWVESDLDFMEFGTPVRALGLLSPPLEPVLLHLQG